MSTLFINFLYRFVFPPVLFRLSPGVSLLSPCWYLSSGRFTLVPPGAVFTLAPAYKQFDLLMIFYTFLAALQAIIFPSEEVLIDISY